MVHEQTSTSSSSSFLSGIISSKLEKSSPVYTTRWVLLGAYQLLFTAILVTFTSICLYSYMETFDPFVPRRYLQTIKTPGLAFRPVPENPYSALIRFQHGGNGNWKPLKDSIKDFLKPYAFGKLIGGSIPCTWITILDRNQRCHVKNRKWVDFSVDNACTGPEGFGYIRGKPCIVLKMNRVYGWVPRPFYNITEILQHESMPVQLKNRLNSTWTKHCKGMGEVKESKCPQLRMVWMTCQGNTPADQEYMGPVTYTPRQGFPGYFYPYWNQMHYLSPLVWLQFQDLSPGVLVSVRCKLWAKNIEHDKSNPQQGGVLFELLMD